MNIRSFIAIEPLSEAREEIAKVICALKEAKPDVKWLDSKSIHLTLKFLGSISEEKIPQITKRLEEVLYTVAPFEITLSDAGVFPGWSHPKVLWIGLAEGANEVKSLVEKVEEATVVEGFNKENRDFKAHLTLGRFKSMKNKDRLKDLVPLMKVNPAASYISKVVLFKSTLTPQGALHEVVSEVSLGTRD